ncbi:MAG TPA: PKD domain-containing protein, partial [Chitinophagaceae bacterium]|nr:PKD domain-containing protein [Chitinophagaceae bacterium]
MKNPPLYYKAGIVIFMLLCSGVVRAQLNASFSAGPLSGCAPLLVSFTDASTGSPDQWEWDLGNGTVSYFQNPSVTYFNPGTYTVKLTVKKAGTTASVVKTQYITVYAAPVVSFVPSATGGCFPLAINFTNNSTPGSGTIANYTWDFGDGNTGTMQNPGNTYNAAGTYNVSLQVTNSNGCSTTLTSPSPITIYAGVKAGFTTGQASSCQAPASIPFTNTSTGTGALSYSWDFGDGTFSSAPNPVHVYNTAGNYTVKLTTSNNSGCSNSYTQPGIAVGVAMVNFTAPAVSCLNENVSFSDISNPVPQSLVWDFGDGTQATDPHPIHAYNALGTYTIKMTANLGHCQDTKTKTIQIIPRPVADFSAPVQVSCKAPFTANFTGIATGATAWEWDFGDGTTASTQSPSHTYTSEGSFMVKLTITNSAGCRETVSKSDFIIIKKPLVEFATQPQKDCIPFAFSPVLHIESVVPITDFQWDFGDGATGSGLNPTHTYTLKGLYTVALTWKTADGCQETIVKTGFVEVGKRVTVDFSASPQLVCASDPILFTDLTGLSTTETIDAWYWIFGDGGTSDQQKVWHAYSDTGRFAVTLTVWSNGCPSHLTKYDYVRILPPIARFKEYVDCSRP